MNDNPDYIRVKLELFEGPLDLLLHLIRIQQIDIASISIARITDQYLHTIELMKELNLDIAGEFLVMAATLILIKSRMLLPPAESDPDNPDAEDPRDELIRRLKQYELFREVSNHLAILEMNRRKTYGRPQPADPDGNLTEWVIDVSLVDLLNALKDIMDRRKEVTMHIIKPNPVSVRQKMAEILDRIHTHGSLLFTDLFDEISTRQEVIATFLAILELVRIQAVRARQKSNLGSIRLLLTQSV